MSKLNLIYVIPRFYPFKGGAELNMLAMSSRAAKDGHKVRIFTSDFKFNNKELAYEEEYLGVSIKRFKSYIYRPMYLWFSPRLFIALVKSEADVIHVSGFGFPMIELALLIRKMLGKHSKNINTPHGAFMAFQTEKSGIRGFSKRIYDRVLKFILPKIYSKVIAVVVNQKVWLKRDYGFEESRVVTIPNGIDINYIEESLTKFKPKDKVIITFTGRMEWYKGIQDVILAIEKLSKIKDFPEFEFRVMGKPDKFTKVLENMISEKDLSTWVKLIFSPSDEQRDREYLNSQISILPSKREATGIVLLEAMAKGNALISTFQNDAVDLIIKDGESGYAYNFGDIKTLTKILKNLILDFKLRQKIREHNLSFAKSFTWEAVYPIYSELLEEVLKA